MIYVGIDIAKFNHFASAISSEGEITHRAVQIYKITDAIGYLPKASAEHKPARLCTASQKSHF